MSRLKPRYMDEAAPVSKEAWDSLEGLTLEAQRHTLEAEIAQKSKKKGGKGPRKGSSFERRICKELSLWWSGGERDDIFWRTAGSGARATVRGRKGQTTANSEGDLAALDPIGEPFLQVFHVEMKRGYPKGFDFLGIIDRPKSYATPKQKKDTIFGWWDKIKEETRINGKIPLIIFQRDKSCDMVCLDPLYFPLIQSGLLYSFQNYNLIFITLEYFLLSFTPERIKEELNRK
jgi:hypothetical protein